MRSENRVSADKLLHKAVNSDAICAHYKYAGYV